MSLKFDRHQPIADGSANLRRRISNLQIFEGLNPCAILPKVKHARRFRVREGTQASTARHTSHAASSELILLLEFVLLIALAIRIVNRKVEGREQSGWSNTPRGWSKGGDCQRIMHRNKPPTLYRRLTLKRSFNATGLKTCIGGGYVKNLTPKRSFVEGRGVQKTSFL